MNQEETTGILLHLIEKTVVLIEPEAYFQLMSSNKSDPSFKTQPRSVVVPKAYQEAIIRTNM